MQYFTAIVISLISVGSMLWIWGAPSSANKSLISQDQQRVDSVTDIQKLDQVRLLKIANEKAENNSDARVEAILALVDHPQELDLSLIVPQLAILAVDREPLMAAAAGIVLSRIGPRGAAYARSLVESEDPREIAAGCTALKEMGGAEEYLELIRSWLIDADPNVRKRALFALQGPNTASLSLLPEIIEALPQPTHLTVPEYFNVQCMACRVIINLGPEGIDAADALLELHKVGIPSVRSWAAHALGAVGPTTKINTPELLAGNLEAFLYADRQRNLLGLAALGPEALPVADRIREVMNDPTKRVMPHAAYTLWRITGEADKPLQTLESLLREFDYVADSIELIGMMGTEAAPLVPALIDILKDPQSEQHENAIIALGNIEAAAAQAIPAIDSFTRPGKTDALTRFYARDAIRKITAARMDKNE